MIDPAFDDRFHTQFDTLLRWRRDVRHFRPTALPEGALAELIETACRAPSVGNAQPWRFVWIRSVDLRDALADHVDTHSAAASTRYQESDRARYQTLKLHGLREAPELLAIFCDEHPRAGHGLGIATMPEMLRYSTVLAIHTLWLAARTRGIGVGWVSILDPVYVATLLDVPAGWTLIALLCIGYPEQPSDVPELEQRGWQQRESWTDRVTER